MSRIKRYLPEDIDVTDPRDTGQYVPEPTEPSDTDRSMAELMHAIRTVEQWASIGELFNYQDELQEASERIKNLREEARKPF